MSYILEALKKLEQKREQEESRKAVTFSVETSVTRSRRRIWPYPVAAALLLNAGVVAWFMARTEVKGTPPAPPGVSRTNEDTRPAPANPSPAQEAALPGQAPLPGQAQATPAEPALQERVSTPARPSQTARVERMAPEPQGRKEAPLPAQPQPPKERTSPPAETRPPGTPRVVSTEPAFTVKELPPFIRNELPDFRVSGHAYSAQSQNRVARINDRIVQEGEELSAGLRLEEIVPDGVILTYQGYRFRIPVTLNR